MKNFYVVANRSKSGIEEYINKVKDYLELRSAKCTIDNDYSKINNDNHTQPEDIPKEAECVIVMGGDGTLLRAANDLADSKLPFLGINLGTLGFLASVDKNDMFVALDRMLEDNYTVEKRMMLRGKIEVSDRGVKDTRALNEIVITGGKPMQLISLAVYVNGKILTKYYSDGLILSTPTGSTGYNLSAGGPIINPTAQMIIMTPICPHSMQNRSIVFSADDDIKVFVEPDRYGNTQEVELLFDGIHQQTLKSGDSVEVSKSDEYTRLIKIKEESFFETLHNKLEG